MSSSFKYSTSNEQRRETLHLITNIYFFNWHFHIALTILHIGLFHEWLNRAIHEYLLLNMADDHNGMAVLRVKVFITLSKTVRWFTLQYLLFKGSKKLSVSALHWKKWMVIITITLASWVARAILVKSLCNTVHFYIY